jgi:hypothetical protein
MVGGQAWWAGIVGQRAGSRRTARGPWWPWLPGPPLPSWPARSSRRRHQHQHQHQHQRQHQPPAPATSTSHQHHHQPPAPATSHSQQRHHAGARTCGFFLSPSTYLNLAPGALLIPQPGASVQSLNSSVPTPAGRNLSVSSGSSSPTLSEASRAMILQRQGRRAGRRLAQRPGLAASQSGGPAAHRSSAAALPDRLRMPCDELPSACRSSLRDQARPPCHAPPAGGWCSPARAEGPLLAAPCLPASLQHAAAAAPRVRTWRARACWSRRAS